MLACRALRNPGAPVRALLRSRRVRGNRRSLANIASSESQQQADSPPDRERVRILLQKTASLLPRTLSTAEAAVGPESSHFWRNVLDRSIAELSTDSERVSLKATIAVCGFDKWARSRHLVVALLEDPFGSDPTYSEMLRDRWKDAPSCVNIEYGKPAAFSGELSSPSNWFGRFPCPIRLTELPDLSALPSTSDETDILLLNSDVLVLLCDPVLTPLSELAIRTKHLLNRPKSILVLVSGSNSDPHRNQFVSRTLSQMGCHPEHILYVDPKQALDAVTALHVDPASPSTIDRYQRDTLGSQISSVTATLNEILRQETPSQATLLDLRQKTALYQVHGSLSASFQSIEATEKDIDLVASEVDSLWSSIQRSREDTRDAMLGKQGADNKVENALSLGTKEMSALLRSLTFLKMIWRVDEIGSLVSTAVQRQWCRGLEDQLVLQTGCLKSTQRELTDAASKLLAVASSTSLRSAILENQLEQLQYSPCHVLTPSSLTQPIYDRRNQLIQHTTTKLHREAQSAVIGVFSGVLSGASLGWWLAFGQHIVGLGVGTEMGTAIGSGALIAVGSIRWAVGKWERAKRRWAQDSERIGEGLTRDIRGTIQRTVDDNVTIASSTACKGMQDLINKRRSEIRQVHGELLELDNELRACAQFPVFWVEPKPRTAKKVDTE